MNVLVVLDAVEVGSGRIGGHYVKCSKSFPIREFPILVMDTEMPPMCCGRVWEMDKTFTANALKCIPTPTVCASCF